MDRLPWLLTVGSAGESMFKCRLVEQCTCPANDLNEGGTRNIVI